MNDEQKTIDARMDRLFLASHLWNSVRGGLPGTVSERKAAARNQILDASVSYDDLKAKSLSWDAVGIAEAELMMARGRFVDADDACLQAIRKYKDARITGSRLDDRHLFAVRSVWKRRKYRANVHAAEDRLVQAALDRIERHWTPSKPDAAHPFVNLGAAMAAE